MAQWFAIKADHPDAILFFRMGDFYELFFADAEATADAIVVVGVRVGILYASGAFASARVMPACPPTRRQA
jgi:hypothetical protein